MQTEYLISVDKFCANHSIEISFLNSLQQTGLIEISTVDETSFINFNQFQKTEKFIRFYYDLDINIEGIETIYHLLQRINLMHDEIALLRNRLRLYEIAD